MTQDSILKILIKALIIKLTKKLLFKKTKNFNIKNFIIENQLPNTKNPMKYTKINASRMYLELKYPIEHLLSILNMRNQEILIKRQVKHHLKIGLLTMKILFTKAMIRLTSTISR